MKKYIFIVLVFYSVLAQTQTVLMEEHVDSVYSKTKFGVNSKHFLHSYFSFGFMFDGKESDVTKFGGTNNLSLGLRYKYRISNSIATGVEAEYKYSTISFPTHAKIQKDKYHFHEFKYAWYLRLNWGMRGDIMGKFIDLGIYGASLFASNQYIKTEGDFKNFQQLTYYQEGLNYIESFNYGFMFRVGINQFVFFSEYRYSDMLNPDYIDIFRTVPRWTVGLQIGFHR